MANLLRAGSRALVMRFRGDVVECPTCEGRRWALEVQGMRTCMRRCWTCKGRGKARLTTGECDALVAKRRETDVAYARTRRSN